MCSGFYFCERDQRNHRTVPPTCGDCCRVRRRRNSEAPENGCIRGLVYDCVGTGSCASCSTYEKSLVLYWKRLRNHSFGCCSWHSYSCPLWSDGSCPLGAKGAMGSGSSRTALYLSKLVGRASVCPETLFEIPCFPDSYCYGEDVRGEFFFLRKEI